jgi:hypothetical protein
MFDPHYSYRTDMSIDNWPPHSPLPSRSITPMLIEPQLWTPRDLWVQLNIPNLDDIDIQRVLNSAADVTYSDRGRAQQTIQTRLFRNWMLSTHSAKLLVHGDFDHPAKISPFSILAGTVSQGFRSSARIISLVFFCGQHLYNDEHHGGTAMIRSLFAQLLRQFPLPTFQPLSDLHPHNIDAFDISQLHHLFVHLVHQLPSNTTVFCIIDGINEYEREEYLHGMDDVVFALMGLVDEGSRASFKLLLLSPRPTVEVRKAFDNEPETLLHMQQSPVVEDNVGLRIIREIIDM